MLLTMSGLRLLTSHAAFSTTSSPIPRAAHLARVFIAARFQPVLKVRTLGPSTVELMPELINQCLHSFTFAVGGVLRSELATQRGK